MFMVKEDVMMVNLLKLPCDRYRWYIFHQNFPQHSAKLSLVVKWNHDLASAAIRYLEESLWEIIPIPEFSVDGFTSSISWAVRASGVSENLMRLREDQVYFMQFRSVSVNAFNMWQTKPLSKVQPQIPVMALVNDYIFRNSDFDIFDVNQARHAVFYLNRNTYNIEMREIFGPEISNLKITRKSQIVVNRLKEIRNNTKNVYERNLKHCAICPFVSECQKT